MKKNNYIDDYLFLLDCLALLKERQIRMKIKKPVLDSFMLLTIISFSHQVARLQIHLVVIIFGLCLRSDPYSCLLCFILN